MQRTMFQLAERPDNERAYRQFFGADSRVPEMQGQGWGGRLRTAWSRAMAGRKSGELRRKLAAVAAH